MATGPSTASLSRMLVRASCRVVLRTVGVRTGVRAAGPVPAGLLIANHFGWIDIVSLLAHVDCAFIAKREVAGWPIIGWAARRVGVIFIDRTRKRDLLRAIPAVTAALRAGRRVLLFPEGTTGDGTALLPFKSALVEAAVQARVPVVPIAVTGRTRSTDAGALCWIGEETLLANVPRVVALRDARVTIHVGTPLAVGPCRKLLTHRARQAIASMTGGAALRGERPGTLDPTGAPSLSVLATGHGGR